MSSGSGLITWGIQENTKRDDDTDEDAEDLEALDVEETVVRKNLKKSYIFIEFIENINIVQTVQDIQKPNYTEDSLWHKHKCNGTSIGQTYFFKCKLPKKCPKALQLIVDSRSETGTIQISEDEHVHEEGQS